MRRVCPDDAKLEQLADGKLTEAEAAELRAHLAGCARCAGIVAAARPAGASRSSTLMDDAEEVAMPVMGECYRLLTQIGRGGMGAVFAAHDSRLGRKVAVKILHSGGVLRWERFRREAVALAKLSHPNVVVIHDSGEEGGAPFLVMELLPGGTLAEWLRARRRGWREVVRLFVLAGRGLAAAHAAGLVHRDFKPANVLIDAAGSPA